MVRKLFTFEIGNLSGLNTLEVLDSIDRLMVHTLELTVENMHDETDRAVPKDTGALRESVHNAISNSNYQAHRITIFIGPPIYYGKWVEKFFTFQVRHAIDPEAVGHYSTHLSKEGKFRLSLNWDLSKKSIGAI